jgi:glycosyltransferase involved in cell wall biosynthesis
MALGTPVVALGEGGVRDSVLDRRTGIFFDRPEVDLLRRALDEVESRQWDRETIRAHAAGFSRARFDQRFREQLSALSSQLSGGRS